MKVVLAYSGGLDTSVILAWLREEYNAEVVAYTADVGQGEEVAEAEEKAMATGAVAGVVDDLREEFVTEAVFPAIRAAAVYETEYLSAHLSPARSSPRAWSGPQESTTPTPSHTVQPARATIRSDSSSPPPPSHQN